MGFVLLLVSTSTPPRAGKRPSPADSTEFLEQRETNKGSEVQLHK